MRKMIFAVILAAVLWFVIFFPQHHAESNFWWRMSFSTSIIGAMSLYLGRGLKRYFAFNWRDAFIGLNSAALLWGMFYVGNWLSSLMFSFAEAQVDSIYALKEGSDKWLLGALLFFLIGPAEEIFWRGYVQQLLEERKGKQFALVATSTVYALVHLWSFNFMLIMAALVCALFWGLLYMYHKNLLTLTLSHAMWDLTVFVLFPI